MACLMVGCGGVGLFVRDLRLLGWTCVAIHLLVHAASMNIWITENIHSLHTSSFFSCCDPSLGNIADALQCSIVRKRTAKWKDAI